MKTIENYKEMGNKELYETTVKLKEAFDVTKQTIINLTYEMDKMEIEYNKLCKELEKRSGTKA